jgi:hypothetical protein
MKFAGKDFGFYWKIIRWPLAIMVAWMLLGFFISLYSFSIYQTWFGGMAGYAVSLAIFIVIGYLAVTDNKSTVKEAAWAGALAGIITGFVSAILGILMAVLVPGMFDASIQQAVKAGADPELVKKMINIMTYVGLVTGPLFSGLIGAGISALSGVICRKKPTRPK